MVAPNEPLRQFALGVVRITPAALAALNWSGDNPLVFLRRHLAGDWGALSLKERQLNRTALVEGNAVRSEYVTSAGEQLCLLTEADWSVTTVMLMEES